MALFIACRLGRPSPRCPLLGRPGGRDHRQCALVASVMVATLLIGPFYLHGAFAPRHGDGGADDLHGPPAGGAVRHACRLAGGQGGGDPVVRLGLGLMVVAAVVLLALAGRALRPLGCPAAHPAAHRRLCALFQTANNSAVVGGGWAEPWRRGRAADPVARNLGQLTGAAGLGVVRRPGGRPDLALATADELVFATRGHLRPDGLAAGMTALWLAGRGSAVQGDAAQDGRESGER